MSHLSGNSLHIASFNGNIGDVTNHNGFRNELKKAGFDWRMDHMEMREFYKSRSVRKFDDAFANAANEYDLLIFGGGGFFDLQWDYSCTGCTIDMGRTLLKK